jgi:hypothetical protein
MSTKPSIQDAHFIKIFSELSNLTNKKNEQILKYNKNLEPYEKILEEFNQKGPILNKKENEYIEKSKNGVNDQSLLGEINQMRKTVSELTEYLTNNKPVDYSNDESTSAESYYKEVVKLVNIFKKTISEPKILNAYFIELLLILNSENITYKNRLIFLGEFKKHLDNEKIIMGIIDALKNRQLLIENYNITVEIIKELELDVDMSLSVYVHKKHNERTVSEIYNSKLNDFIYKYCVYSYCEYAKNTINKEKKNDCDKYEMFYNILDKLNSYREPNLNNFPPMMVYEDLT